MPHSGPARPRMPARQPQGCRRPRVVGPHGGRWRSPHLDVGKRSLRERTGPGAGQWVLETQEIAPWRVSGGVSTVYVTRGGTLIILSNNCRQQGAPGLVRSLAAGPKDKLVHADTKVGQIVAQGGSMASTMWGRRHSARGVVCLVRRRHRFSACRRATEVARGAHQAQCSGGRQGAKGALGPAPLKARGPGGSVDCDAEAVSAVSSTHDGVSRKHGACTWQVKGPVPTAALREGGWGQCQGRDGHWSSRAEGETCRAASRHRESLALAGRDGGPRLSIVSHQPRAPSDCRRQREERARSVGVTRGRHVYCVQRSEGSERVADAVAVVLWRYAA